MMMMTMIHVFFPVQNFLFFSFGPFPTGTLMIMMMIITRCHDDDTHDFPQFWKRQKTTDRLLLPRTGLLIFSSIGARNRAGRRRISAGAGAIPRKCWRKRQQISYLTPGLRGRQLRNPNFGRSVLDCIDAGFLKKRWNHFGSNNLPKW